jgi:hypothetical protein
MDIKSEYLDHNLDPFHNEEAWKITWKNLPIFFADNQKWESIILFYNGSDSSIGWMVESFI